MNFDDDGKDNDEFSETLLDVDLDDEIFDDDTDLVEPDLIATEIKDEAEEEDL